MNENPPENPQQTQANSDKLKPQQLMDMILLEARAYTIKYTAARKREERDIKQKTQDQINDTVRLLELDDGHSKEYTDNLTERITILKENIQLKLDNDEIEKTRKYMAKRNLKAETPTKTFCNQVKKSKKKAKLQCLLQERKLTLEEQNSNPQQKQYTEITCQHKIKAQVKEFYGRLYYFQPTNPDKEEIIHAIGAQNIKTLNTHELENTEKDITMAEIEFCLQKTRNNIAPGSSGFSGAFYKAFWPELKHIVHLAINFIYHDNELPESLRFGIVHIIPKGQKAL